MVVRKPPVTAKTKPIKVQTLSGYALVDVAGSADREPPKEFCLFQRGVNHTEKGDFLFDDAAAESVMSWFAAKGVDLPIDYEHEMVDGGVTGKKLAAGWFGLEVRDGALWATNVRWTPAATAHLQDAEYRYFSPAFDYDQESGRVAQLINFALTNRPAMNAIPALVAASANVEPTTEKPMEEKLAALEAKLAELTAALAAKTEECAQLSAKLGAEIEIDPAAEDPEKLSATLSASSRKFITAASQFRREVLGVTGKTSEAAAIGVLHGWREKSAEIDTLRADVAKRETAALSATFDALLEEATKAGRLEPAKHATVKSIATKVGGGSINNDAITFAREYLSALPVVVKGADGATRSTPAELADSETGREMDKHMGINPVEFAAYRVAKLAAR